MSDRGSLFSLSSAIVVASCGEGSEPASDSTTIDDGIVVATTTTAAAGPATSEAGAPEISPCDIVGISEVQEAFRGTVGAGAEFPGGACRFSVEDGAVIWVDVVYLGTADQWEDLRARYESGRGGIVAVDGVGEDAFHPQDHGVRDLIFTAHGNIYAVLGFGGPTEEQLKELGESVAALAMTIAESND